MHFNHKHPFIIGLIVFVFVLLITQLLTVLNYRRIIANEQNRVISAVNASNIRLQENLSHSLAVTSTLNYIMETNGIPKDFEKVGKELLKAHKNIAAVEIVEHGTIRHVYPLKGNERVIGYNILKDSNRNLEALKTIDKKTLFFAGPLELKQGGTGIVGRLPMFKDSIFMGFSAVIIRLDTLLAVSGIYPSYDPDLQFQLSKPNPNTHREEYFIPLNDTNFSDGHAVKVDLPMGEWKLYVKLRDGTSMSSMLPLSLLGLLLAIITGVFAWFIGKQPFILKKQVEEKIKLLNHNEMLLKMTQESAKVGSWELNCGDDTMEWTDTTKRIYEVDLGFRPDKRSLIQFTREGAYRNELEQVFKSMMHEGGAFDIDSKIITAKGHERWVRISGRCDMLNGKCHKIYGATQDIHEHMLSESEKIDILESITVAFIACNTNWDVTYWNRAAESMFKVDSGDIIGKNLKDFMGGNGDAELILEFETAKTHQHMHTFEFYSERMQLWAEVSIFPKHNGFSAYLKDITEQHKHLYAIEQQNKRLNEIAWLQSHVVRAPLARMLGSLDLLDSEKTEEEKKILMDFVLKSAVELDEIISDISEKTTEIKFDEGK